MAKTAVVFGSTGMAGKDLVNEMLQCPAYDKIVVVVRREIQWKHPKLVPVIVPDFDSLPDYISQFQGDVFFVCLGTTIKTAGSQDAFRKVDFDYPVAIASMAEKCAVSSMVVISSVGANASSGNFYLRTKGQMEQSVRQSYSGNLKFVRPSLLMGNRDEYRFGEKISVTFMKIAGWTLVGPLKRYRGIASSQVARAMMNAVDIPANIVFIESEQLIPLADKKPL